MCHQRNAVEVEVADPMVQEAARVDGCIADLVQALNDAGLATFNSCCGHGKHIGVIDLLDGRELLVLHDSNSALRPALMCAVRRYFETEETA